MDFRSFQAKSNYIKVDIGFEDSYISNTSIIFKSKLRDFAPILLRIHSFFNQNRPKIT